MLPLVLFMVASFLDIVWLWLLLGALWLLLMCWPVLALLWVLLWLYTLVLARGPGRSGSLYIPISALYSVTSLVRCCGFLLSASFIDSVSDGLHIALFSVGSPPGAEAII